MLIAWKEYISTWDNNGDKSYIKGTDIAVSQVMDLLASGKNIDDIVKDLDGISYEHIFACLEYSRQKNAK